MEQSGVVVVTAHPDDETLIAGGVLAACAEAGCPTGVICLTRGEYGPIANSRLATRETLGAVRLHELEAACAELGVRWLRCYRRMDSHLPWTNSTGVARQLARVLERWRPAAVVTFGPDGLYDHPDHVAVSRFTRRALDLLCAEDFQAPRPRLYEALWPRSLMVELVAELRERGLGTDLWGIPAESFGVSEPATVTVDVRPVVPRKLRALRCHRTQLAPDHAFSALPEDLARRFLGIERFRRRSPADPGCDWLAAHVAQSLDQVAEADFAIRTPDS